MGKIQRKCDFMAGWDSGYTRPPKKENQNIRIGGAHGLTSKARPVVGGFKGLKTWNISAQVSRVAGVESRGRSGAFCEYMEKEKECVIAYGDTPSEGKKKYAELEEKLFKQKKNSVIQRRFVIPLPKEILNSPLKVEKLLKTLQTRYFSSCYAFSAALHKSTNLKNPHIHIAYSNADRNFKAIREFQDPNMLDAVKKDIKNFIEAELKIPCQMKGIGKSIKHYPKWLDGAVKRAQEAEKRGDGGKMMKEYTERYPAFAEYVSERKRKLYERAIQLKENKIKKITEGEIGHIEELNQKIKKRSASFFGKFYNKKEKEQVKQDLAVNQGSIDNLKKNTENLNFAGELAEKERRAEARNQKPKGLKIEDPEKALKPKSQKTADLIYFKQFQNLKTEYPDWEKLNKDKKSTVMQERTKAFKTEFPDAKFDKEKIAWALDANIPDIEERLKNFTTEDVKAVQAVIVEEQAEQKQEPLTPGNDKEITRDEFAEDLERRLNKKKGPQL